MAVNQMSAEQRKHFEDAMIGFLLAHPEHIGEVQQTLPDQTYFTNHDNGITYYFLCEMDSHGIIPKGRRLPAELYRLSHSDEGRRERLVYSYANDAALSRALAGCLTLWNKEYGAEESYKELAKFIRWHCHDAILIKQLAQDIVDRVGGIPESQSEEFATSLSQRFDKIALQVQDAGELQHISEATADIEALLDLMGEWKQTSNSTETGLKALDNVLGGLNAGEVIVLAAQTGAGKTALSMTIAENVALGIGTGEPRSVIIFSLEMMNTQLHFRMASRLGRINTEKFNLDYKSIINRQGRIERGENMPQADIDQLEADKDSFRHRYDRLRETVRYSKSLPIYQDTAGNMNVSVMKTMISQKQKEIEERGEPPLGLVIIDYLQILQPTAEDANENRSVVVGNMSRRIKQMAKNAGVPVLLLAQLNRQSDVDQKPKLSHLRESGSIEQDADKVIFLYCEHAGKELRDYASEYDTEPQQDLAMKRDQMKVKIAVEKNRQGRQGEVNAIFDKQFQNFVTQTPNYKKGETFDQFFDKYYQMTRSGTDLFWPLKAEEIPPELEKYRSRGIVENPYLGEDGQIVLPNDAGSSGSGRMGVTSRSSSTGLTTMATGGQSALPVTPPPVTNDLKTGFEEIPDDDDDYDAGAGQATGGTGGMASAGSGDATTRQADGTGQQAGQQGHATGAPHHGPEPATDDTPDPDERYEKGWHTPPFVEDDEEPMHSELDFDTTLYDDDDEMFDLSTVDELDMDYDDDFDDEFDSYGEDDDEDEEYDDDSLAMLDELSDKL